MTARGRGRPVLDEPIEGIPRGCLGCLLGEVEGLHRALAAGPDPDRPANLRETLLREEIGRLQAVLAAARKVTATSARYGIPARAAFADLRAAVEAVDVPVRVAS